MHATPFNLFDYNIKNYTFIVNSTSLFNMSIPYSWTVGLGEYK